MTDDFAHKNDSDIFLGGLNIELIRLTQIHLKTIGFRVRTNIELPKSKLNGKEPNNVTNRCASKMGMHVEISESLRQNFFHSELKLKVGRIEKTTLFEDFCNTINDSILSYAFAGAE